MAVFLTKNSPGLRTSPVKRGDWVVKNVLGERIPPPPPKVPELPRDEAKLDLPLREMLARHRADAGCAACHARFDSFGLVFEGFGPIGERREKDLAGRPIDASATSPAAARARSRRLAALHPRTGKTISSPTLRQTAAYAWAEAYDSPIEPNDPGMQGKLAKDQYRFGRLIESIVTSPPVPQPARQRRDFRKAKMMTNQHQNRTRGMPRRAFLQGVGVTMALPWLESLSAGTWRFAAAGGANAAALPKRFAVMFMGNGVSPDHWWRRAPVPPWSSAKPSNHSSGQIESQRHQRSVQQCRPGWASIRR